MRSTASPSPSHEASPSAAASAEATPLTPADLAHAVVQVLMFTSDGLVGTGSGTIIDPSGLILTNAHVATPSDLALTELQVAITGKSDHPAVPTYDAEVAAADTVLDLAVIRITAALDGSALPDAFPFVKVGDSDALDIGDDISIFGYPGIGGNTITFTSGQVSGFTGEAVLGDRAWIKTDATIAGGNSGGLAANDAGEIIGVPTRSGTTSEIVDCRVIVDTNRDGVINEQDTCVPLGGFINGLRPIAFAEPLISAARGGVAYVPIGGLPEPGGSPQPSQGVRHHQRELRHDHLHQRRHRGRPGRRRGRVAAHRRRQALRGVDLRGDGGGHDVGGDLVARRRGAGGAELPAADLGARPGRLVLGLHHQRERPRPPASTTWPSTWRASSRPAASWRSATTWRPSRWSWSTPAT